MTWVSTILTIGLMANLAAPALPMSDTSAALSLTCLGNAVELPFLKAFGEDLPDERPDRPHHQACHAVCCKRDVKVEKEKKPEA